MSGERSVNFEGSAIGNTVITGDGNTFVLQGDAKQTAVVKPVTLPYPSIGTLFKGRQGVLRDLRTSLSVPQTSQSMGVHVKVLHGLGGVGKTRLAVEYAHLHGDQYSALIFVNAETSADLARNLARLSGEIIPGPTAAEAPEESVRLDAALRWMRATPRWLLILDNVDTEEAASAVEGMLSKLCGGDVLITSRFTQWGPGVETLELDVLSLDDSRAFLLERTDKKRRSQPSDVIDAAGLATRLDGLALALEQAGAYIAYRRVSIDDYNKDWDLCLQEVKAWHSPRLMKYPRSLAVTWETTLQHLGVESVALLRLLAFLAPDPIPSFLLDGNTPAAVLDMATNLLLDEDSASVTKRASVAEALANLVNFSMVRWETNGYTQSISMHRVVQDIIRSHVPVKHSSAWLAATLSLLDAARPFDAADVRTWPIWDPLIPHVSQVLRQAEECSLNHLTSGMLNGLGSLLLSKALYQEAEPLLKEALEVGNKYHGAESLEAGLALNNLSALFRVTDRTIAAERLIRQAIDIFELHLGKQHPLSIMINGNLAQALKKLGRFVEAETIMLHVLEALDRKNSAPDPYLGTALNNLAILVHDQGRVEEAETLLHRAIAADEAAYGTSHPYTARDRANLAQFLKEKGLPSEAELLLKDSIQVLKASLGDQHPRVAPPLNNLARLRQEAGRTEEAEVFLREIVLIYKSSFGTRHSEYGLAIKNLGSFLASIDRNSEAIPLLQESLSVLEKTDDYSLDEVSSNLCLLASLHWEAGELKESCLLLNRALKILESELDPSRRKVGLCLHNLAAVYLQLNQVDKAEPLICRALAIVEADADADHSFASAVYATAGGIYRRACRLSEAETYMRNAIARDKASGKSTWPEAAIHLGNLSHLLLDEDRLQEAEVVSRECLEIMIKWACVTNEEHPYLQDAMQNYADVLSDRGLPEIEIRALLQEVVNESSSALIIRE